METQNLTIEQCQQAEDKLTRQAVEYANLIRNPQQRALAAKDVITGLPDKEITVAFNDGYRMQLNELGTEVARQLIKERRNCESRHTAYAGTANKELASLKGSVSKLETQDADLIGRVRACSAESRELKQRVNDELQKTYLDSKRLSERLQTNERDVGSLESRKASRTSVYLLALATTLQSAYIGVELARQPGTYANKAYQAVKNWLAE